MDIRMKEAFSTLWNRHFDGAELPIVFYYAEDVADVERAKPTPERQCVIQELNQVRMGNNLCFDAQSVGCFGGKRYLGFAHELRPNFEYFLSCGIPGKLEGERYKKSPELVKEVLKKTPRFSAPARFIVFKRWDTLEEHDEPQVVVFFARPDVLSGLFTLANFDQADPNGVFCPSSAGCGSIVQYPYLEKDSENPRAVLGMFDVSARPWVPEDRFTFAVPMGKFARMVQNMEESFLITPSWSKVKQRIGD